MVMMMVMKMEMKKIMMMIMVEGLVMVQGEGGINGK